jgi:hypothetical protein
MNNKFGMMTRRFKGHSDNLQLSLHPVQKSRQFRRRFSLSVRKSQQ